MKPPLFDFEMSGLMLSFQANPDHVRTAAEQITQPGLGEKLGETRAAIIEAMRASPKVSTRKLAEHLGLSMTAMDKNIQYLREQGYVKRVGPAKGGHWEVLK